MADELFDTMDVVADGPIEIDLEGPIQIDLGGVKDEPVAQGWHTVLVERAEGRLSSQQKLPMIFVLSRIADEADPDYNHTIIWNNMLTGEGLVFTKRCFKALGLPVKLDFPSVQALADELIGRSVEVRIKHKMHEGELQANASNWRAVTFSDDLGI